MIELSFSAAHVGYSLGKRRIRTRNTEPAFILDVTLRKHD